MKLIRPAIRQDSTAIQQLLERGIWLCGEPALESLDVDRLLDESDIALRLSEGEAASRILLVLEDKGRLEGVLAIDALLSTQEPCLHYRLGIDIYRSQHLGVYLELQTLTLGNHLTNASAFGFWVHERDCQPESYNFLLQGAIHFVLANIELFGERLFCHIPSSEAEPSLSPFWQSLGQNFMPGHLADTRPAMALVEFLPRTPIHCHFLPAAVIERLGCPSPARLTIKNLLKKSDFCFQKVISPLDAGPIMEVEIEQLQSLLREKSRQLTLSQSTPTEQANTSDNGLGWLVRGQRERFKCGLIPIVEKGGEELVVDADIAELFSVSFGEKTSLIPYDS